MLNLEDIAVDFAVNAITSLLAGGTIRIYSHEGTTMAELGLSSPAFNSAKGGIAKAFTIGKATAKTTGIARNFKAFTANGLPVFGGSVGTMNADLNLNYVQIQAGADVSINSMTFKLPKSEVR